MPTKKSIMCLLMLYTQCPQYKICTPRVHIFFLSPLFPLCSPCSRPPISSAYLFPLVRLFSSPLSLVRSRPSARPLLLLSTQTKLKKSQTKREKSHPKTQIYPLPPYISIYIIYLTPKL